MGGWAVPLPFAAQPPEALFAQYSGGTTVVVPISQTIPGGLHDTARWTVIINGISRAVTQVLGAGQALVLTVPGGLSLAPGDTVSYNGQPPELVAGENLFLDSFTVGFS